MSVAVRSPGMRLLLSVPFPLTWRNFIPTGLAAGLEDGLNARVHLVSPYAASSFADSRGRTFVNHSISARQTEAGIPTPHVVTRFDKALKLVQQTGFAREHPWGSLQMRDLSRQRNVWAAVAAALIALAPRGSRRRTWLRWVYGAYRPHRSEISKLFECARPQLLIVSSPGHYWLDFLLMDEARRRGIPSLCIVQSWDNLYSRGSMHRRPDFLCVWSPEMARQAQETHQIPLERIGVVGPLQFTFYGEPVVDEEMACMRAAVGLASDEPYLAYICGARTAEYDVEDVLAMLPELRRGPHRDLRVVVRPHPQGSRKVYAQLREYGVLIDESPEIVSEEARPDAFDLGAVRHMACLMTGARFAVSSWGTTVLLEACVFGTPALQLRWMNSVSHVRADQVRNVIDFQNYMHMRPFDACGSRLFSDAPADLNDRLKELMDRAEEFTRRREETLRTLTCLPLDGVVSRISTFAEQLISNYRYK